MLSIAMLVSESRPDWDPHAAEAQLGSASSLPLGHLNHSCLQRGLMLTSHPRGGTRALVSELMKLRPFEAFRRSRVSLELSSVSPGRRRDARTWYARPVLLWGRMTASLPGCSL